jgi:hypothetical protein
MSPTHCRARSPRSAALAQQRQQPALQQVRGLAAASSAQGRGGHGGGARAAPAGDAKARLKALLFAPPTSLPGTAAPSERGSTADSDRDVRLRQRRERLEQKRREFMMRAGGDAPASPRAAEPRERQLSVRRPPPHLRGVHRPQRRTARRAPSQAGWRAIQARRPRHATATGTAIATAGGRNLRAKCAHPKWRGSSRSQASERAHGRAPPRQRAHNARAGGGGGGGVDARNEVWEEKRRQFLARLNAMSMGAPPPSSRAPAMDALVSADCASPASEARRFSHAARAAKTYDDDQPGRPRTQYAPQMQQGGGGLPSPGASFAGPMDFLERYAAEPERPSGGRGSNRRYGAPHASPAAPCRSGAAIAAERGRPC